MNPKPEFSYPRAAIWNRTECAMAQTHAAQRLAKTEYRDGPLCI
jgi:hypothetical protein